MEEKRRGMRRTIFYYLPVLHRESGEEIGKLGDISESGVLIITDDIDTLTSGKLPVDIVLPVALKEKQKVLSVDIEARWTRRDSNPLYYLAGCEMVSAPEQQEIIDELIDMYAFSDGYKDLRKEMEKE